MKSILLKIILLTRIPLEPVHVETFLAGHGIKARVQIVDLSQPLVLGNQLQVFYAYRQAFNEKNSYKHVFTEPFKKDDQEFMLGLAVKSERISMSTWNDLSTSGQPRTIHSWQIFAHELGHVLGLSHSTGCIDLMDADLGRCENIASLSFTKEQLKKIKKGKG